MLPFALLLASADAVLNQAYDALRAGNLDAAVSHFRQGIALAPDRAGVRKDFAYALLKTGDAESARDQFLEASRLDPADQHAALEYAFLAFETRQPAEARRIFLRLRDLGNATAAKAFENIDKPLADGVARWRAVLASDPANFSAHQELARLAAERDDHALAADHSLAAWRLKPGIRSLLVDLARAWKAAGKDAEALSALLAASRGAEPRSAEQARELLPARYPYVYEFRAALALDPANPALHRELAYLLLEMQDKAGAEIEFRAVLTGAPEDMLSAAQLGFLLLARNERAAAMPLLERVLEKGDGELADRVRTALRLPQALKRREETPRAKVTVEAKELAQKSLEKGYIKDALKYLRIAHENDPVDFDVMLKLGWANNMTKDDKEAIRWFGLASSSPDQKVAAEAKRAYKNLEPALERFRATVWIYPFFSSRWRDVFGYGQIKSEILLPGVPVRPYVSTRLIGDTRGYTREAHPAALSESAAIIAIGLSTPASHGVTAWAEAGSAFGFRSGHATPDYRGGISFAHLKRRGALFGETNDDALYVSRFGHDGLLYSQNKIGYAIGESKAEVFWNANVTVDARRQYWANFAESGPGVRWRLGPAQLSVSAVRGAYLINTGNPRRPNFTDIRAGVWYAISK